MAAPLLPGTLDARFVVLGSTRINLVWRIFGGLSVPLRVCLDIRRFSWRHAAAAGQTVRIIADVGLAGGRPIEVDAKLLCHQWRLRTPSLSLIFLMLHLGSVAVVGSASGRAGGWGSGAEHGRLGAGFPGASAARPGYQHGRER
jgi:hypothetical protein